MSHPDPFPTPNQSSEERIDRRMVITTAGVFGVGVVGAATLVACGWGGTATATTNPGGSATRSSGSASDAIKVSDIPVGGGKVFEAAQVVVTQPRSGEFKAFSAICTHQGCLVANVAHGTINCTCHGSSYNMTTGAVTAGPAPAPLPSRTATVSGGSITVSS